MPYTREQLDAIDAAAADHKRQALDDHSLPTEYAQHRLELAEQVRELVKAHRHLLDAAEGWPAAVDHAADDPPGDA